MANAERLLAKMRANPRGDYTIDQFKTLARRFDIDFRQPGTSHVTFRHRSGERLTVPASRRIKPVYIKRFVEIIDAIRRGLPDS